MDPFVFFFMLWQRTLRRDPVVNMEHQDPQPVPGTAPASVDRLALLDNGLDGISQRNIPVLIDMISPLDRGIARVQRILEIRGRELREYAKVGELNELRRSMEFLQRLMDIIGNETVRTPSLKCERQAIPVYNNKRKGL